MGKTLNSNAIYSALSNMIISIETMYDNLDGLDTSIAEEMKVDGSMYGDTKTYIMTDKLDMYEFDEINGPYNLLSTFFTDPTPQYLTIDQAKQIPLSLSSIMGKQGFGSADAYSQFTGVMQSWLRDTKRIHDKTYVQTFIGTHETALNNQTRTITLPTDTDKEKEARLQAQTIAEALANLEVELADVNTVNDLGFTRSWNKDQLEIVWNAKWKNKILKIDLPTIFHKDGLIDFEGKTMPEQYFGVEMTAANVANYTGNEKPFAATTGKYQPSKGKAYSATAQTITVDGVKHRLMAHDELPENTVVNAATINAGLKVYVPDENIMFKIIKKGNACPYIGAFEQNTSFFNPQNHITNYYLTFVYNTLDHLKQYPWITVRKA